MQFRKDINGLRAFAVIAVVLFHFNSTWMPGGFAGVDVFFVISGFLMTKIIFKGLEQNNFSILNFYVARANRIIPALALLCLVLLVFGWLYLTPLEYRALGKHAASSVSFLSNIVYWREAGYFDAVSHEKWLLHTWSLSVEWQFYIIYPVVLVALRKLFTIKTIKLLLVIGTVLGFIFSVVATYKSPNASYYLFPMRAWEMMVGGVAYFYPFALQENKKKLFELIGLVLIIASYFLISAKNLWPGYLALLPVLGSFLIIQAQHNESVITGNIICQKLGAWSYSIYLWHWPFVVAIYTFSMPSYYIYIGIILSIVFGFLSYRYVEQIKFPRGFPKLISYLKSIPIYLAAFIVVLGSVVFFKDGIDNRFELSDQEKQILDQLVMPYRGNGYCFYSSHEQNFKVSLDMGTNCYLGDRTVQADTLLFGDSYAGHNEPFFDKVFKANNSSFQSVVTNWCTPSLSDDFAGPKDNLAYKQCLLNRKYLIDNLTNYKTIIFSGLWKNIQTDEQKRDLEKIIQKASKEGVNVIIMAAPKSYTTNPLEIFKKSLYFNINPVSIDNNDDRDLAMRAANKTMESLAEKYENVYFINRSYLYEEDNTFNIGGLNIPYSYDGGHISILGSKYSAKYFMAHPDYELIRSYFKFTPKEPLNPAQN